MVIIFLDQCQIKLERLQIDVKIETATVALGVTYFSCDNAIDRAVDARKYLNLLQEGTFDTHL